MLYQVPTTTPFYCTITQVCSHLFCILKCFLILLFAESTPKSPSYKSLPTTPKSACSSSTFAMNPPDSAGKRSTDSSSTSALDAEDEQNDIGGKQQFILAPTPAQLGRAKFPRRKNFCMYWF